MWLSKISSPQTVARPTATLPQTAQKPMFVITGKVSITHIIGEVTTVMQALANATKLCYRNNAGVSADLCATNDITGDVVGSYYTITGVAATAMANVATSPALKLTNPLQLDGGTIDLNCAASATGAIKWTIIYVPLEPNASVVAL